jgi:hypothetical protein
MKAVAALLLPTLVFCLEAAPANGRPGQEAGDPAPSETRERPEEAPAEVVLHPEDKTLVAALDIEQGNGKERLSLYRDGTLALVKTYEGVRTLRKKFVPQQEVDLVRRVCLEAATLEVERYQVDVLGPGEPRRFRIEIGRPDAEPRTFLFDELARTPLVLGRARGVLEGLFTHFDETLVSAENIWDPSGLVAGDVLVHRTDGRRYRIVRDDAFVRSLELIEAERSLHRLFVLREEVPKIFFAPPGEGKEGVRR